MHADSNAIFQAAASLPENERWALIARLIDSLPAADGIMAIDDPGLEEELDRRFANSAASVDWEDLRNQTE